MRTRVACRQALGKAATLVESHARTLNAQAEYGIMSTY